MSDSNNDSSSIPDPGDINSDSTEDKEDSSLVVPTETHSISESAWFQSLLHVRRKESSASRAESPQSETDPKSDPDPIPDGDDSADGVGISSWFQNLWKSAESQNSACTDAESDPQNDRNPKKTSISHRITGLFNRGFSSAETDPSNENDSSTEENLATKQIAQDRSKLANAFGKAVNSVSDPQDRREVVNWFVEAYDVLATEPQTKQKIAKLYRLMDSRKVGKLIVNTARTASKSYRGSNLPLSIKLALPVTTLGACMFGTQGAGIVAFGSGIGLPVVLLLFLGSAGVASIIEALIRDKRNLEPTTRLLLSLIQLETTRRINKDLASKLKADLETPRRCDIQGDENQLLSALRKMDPFDFERHVMSFFEACGHPSGVTRKSKDNGFDGWVDHPKGLLVVQCKRYNPTNVVGRPEIQQFKGVIEEQEAYHGYLVTTSTYSKEAQDSAELSDKLTLIDCEKVLDWHKQSKVDLNHLTQAK